MKTQNALSQRLLEQSDKIRAEAEMSGCRMWETGDGRFVIEGDARSIAAMRRAIAFEAAANAVTEVMK